MAEDDWRLYPILEGDIVIVPPTWNRALWSRGRKGTVEGITGYEESVIDIWSKVLPKVLIRFADGSSKWYRMRDVIRVG